MSAGNGVLARERNVEHIGLVVSSISIHASSKTGRSKRKRGFTDHGLAAIVTVGVTPDTIDLRVSRFRSCTNEGKIDNERYIGWTHNFVVANNCHDAQGLNAMFPWVEGRPSGLRSVVAENNVRVNIRVQVIDSGLVTLNLGLERRLRLRVGRGTASAVSMSLRTVAINVHVREATSRPLDVDDIVIAQVVATIAVICDAGNLSMLGSLGNLFSWDILSQLTSFAALLAMEAGLEDVGALLPATNLVVKGLNVGWNVSCRRRYS